jgi:photosystem II stability/assembly factor-like uncharacterized protein
MEEAVCSHGTEGGGVFRSTNNGTAWTEVNNGLTDRFVFALAADKAGTLYAGTASKGIFRSTDNGTSWIASNAGMLTQSRTSVFVNYIAVNDSNQLFVATLGDGIFCSLDGGATWLQIDSNLTDLNPGNHWDNKHRCTTAHPGSQ